MRRVLAVVITAALAAGLAPALAATRTAGGPPAPRVAPDLAARVADAAGDELVVFVHGADAATAAAAAERHGLRVVDHFDRVGVAVAVGDAEQIDGVTADGAVTYVEPDRPIDLFLETSHVATRGEEARQLFTTASGAVEPGPGRGKGSANGNGKAVGRPSGGDTGTEGDPIDGRGHSIAVIDSGVDGTHPMFQQEGRSKVVRNLKLACGYLTACTGEQGDAIDPAFIDLTAVNDTDTPSLGGHGTHVASIAAGVEVEAPDGRVRRGAAPGASVVSLSVGQVISVYGGAAGMNWVLEHHAAPCGEGVDPAECPPITVVNNSWGSRGEYDPESVTAKIQDALVADGVVVVWAAGNGDELNRGGDGSDNRVNPPSTSPTPGVLSVANYDDGDSGNRDNALASSSSRGHEARKATWPDISAPGTNITAACRPYLAVCASGEGDYGTTTGTSMAAPHIAGIVTLLQQADPALTPAQIEDILEDTAHQFTFGAPYASDLPDRNADHTTSFDKGHGLVDVVAALSRALGTTAPAGASVCTADGPVVTDREGDATRIINETPLPSESTLDVIEGRVDWDAGAEALTFTISVSDLTDANPTGTSGIVFDFNFSYDGKAYYLLASRSDVDGEEFVFGHIVTTRQTIAPVAGSFDVDADTVTMVLTNEVLAGAGITPMADGDVLSGFSVVSRREMNLVAVSFIPDADAAGGRCPYTLGLGAVPPPPAEGGEEPDPDPAPAPEPDATLTDGQTFEATGNPPEATLEHECSGPNDPACVTYVLDLQPSSGSGQVDIAITADFPLDDFDLYLYDLNGTRLGGTANALTVGEAATVAIPAAGLYYLVVQPYFADPVSEYTVTATLRPS